MTNPTTHIEKLLSTLKNVNALTDVALYDNSFYSPMQLPALILEESGELIETSYNATTSLGRFTADLVLLYPVGDSAEDLSNAKALSYEMFWAALNALPVKASENPSCDEIVIDAGKAVMRSVKVII